MNEIYSVSNISYELIEGWALSLGFPLQCHFQGRHNCFGFEMIEDNCDRHGMAMLISKIDYLGRVSNEGEFKIFERLAATSVANGAANGGTANGAATQSETAAQASSLRLVRSFEAYRAEARSRSRSRSISRSPAHGGTMKWKSPLVVGESPLLVDDCYRGTVGTAGMSSAGMSSAGMSSAGISSTGISSTGISSTSTTMKRSASSSSSCSENDLSWCLSSTNQNRTDGGKSCPSGNDSQHFQGSSNSNGNVSLSLFGSCVGESRRTENVAMDGMNLVNPEHDETNFANSMKRRRSVSVELLGNDSQNNHSFTQNNHTQHTFTQHSSTQHSSTFMDVG